MDKPDQGAAKDLELTLYSICTVDGLECFLNRRSAIAGSVLLILQTWTVYIRQMSLRGQLFVLISGH